MWSVNPDANTVTVIHAATGQKVAEHAVGANPRGIARDANGRYWVTCFASDEIRILNADGTLHQTITLEVANEEVEPWVEAVLLVVIAVVPGVIFALADGLGWTHAF